MPTIVQEYVEKYTLDARGYVTGAQRVQRTTQSLKDAHDDAEKGVGRLRKSFNDAWGSIGMAATAGVAAIAAVGAAGGAAYKQYAEFEALKLALQSVEGSAGEAENAIKRLQKIAAAPGLGVQEAIGGYLQLRNAGADQSFAEGIVREFGNAVARGGGGKEQLAGILRQISQSLNKPFLQGEELSVIAEAGVPAYKLLQQKFGTSDGEELKKRGIGSEQALRGLLEELAKLPRVTGGAKNSLENLSDSWQRLVVSIGAGEAGAGVGLNALSDAIGKVADSGAATAAVQGFAESMGRTFTILTGNGDKTQALAEAFLTPLATLQTLGTVIETLTEGFKGVGEAISNAFNRLPDWLKRYLGGIASVNSGIGPQAFTTPGGVQDEFQKNLDNLRAKLNAPPAPVPGPKQTEAKTSAPSPDLPKIALNTERTANAAEKLNQMANLVLGGGTVGQAGLSLNDLSAIKNGRGGRNDVRGLLMQVADIFEGLERKTERNRPMRYASTG